MVPLFCTLPPFLYTFLRNLCFTSGPLFSTIPKISWIIPTYLFKKNMEIPHIMWVCKVVQLRGSLVKRVDVGDIMLVTIFGCWWRKKHVGDIFWDVGDNQIGHQHHKTRKYDVGDRFRMLVTLNASWWHFFVCWCQLWSVWTITLIPNPNP